ncbi:MAG TPA: hypothetical protein VJ476_09145 [Rhizomicrobium sp.]|nr:hypothetical protein [Rhizomicrobium sp.]
MSITLIVQLVEALAAMLGQLAPLVADGKSLLAESDADKIHAALQRAQAATAALRGQVDAALAAAADA